MIEKHEQSMSEAATKIIEDNFFRNACSSMAKLLEEKNRRYGNSALEPLNVFSGKTKVGHRLDDKLARVKFSGTLKKNDVSDLIGYLMLVCKENGWESFDDLID